MTVAQAFAQALEHHQSGRLAAAETLYRQILALDPHHTDALHYLGVIACQTGRNDAAENLIRQAIALRPDYPEALSNLGNVFKGEGRLDEAIAAYRQAIGLQPNFPEAYSSLGNTLWEQGKVDEAIAAYRQAIGFKPHYPEAYCDLGKALWKAGQLDEAIAASRQAIALQPNYPEAYNNLGVVLKARGELDQALMAYRQAIALKPDLPEAYTNLGNAEYDKGQLDEAIAAFRHAIALRPSDAEAHSDLGNVLGDAGRLGEAVVAHRRAIALKPDYHEAQLNLGNAYYENGQLDEAIDAYGLALKLNPAMADAHTNLGNALLSQGRPDEAIAAYRQALQMKPFSTKFHSNLLAGLHYSPGTTCGELLVAHSEYERRHAAPLRGGWREHANEPGAERQLKVGYVSPDFRHNVVGHFLLPLLEAHDHERFAIHCYAGVRRPDAITERFRRTADVWREVLGLGDEVLAEQIRADRIDILVDLSQHMPGNRLLVFARKPAPVQVAWLGHPWSTGLRAIDYRLTDARLEPEGAAWSESVETTVRLPDSWFCFDPLDEYPEPGELPALRTGYVTFGCLNNFSRVHEGVLQRWAGILGRVADSRLLLRCPAGATQTRVRHFFETRGIAAGRVEFVGWTASRADFQRLFARMDIALDPFPYNGGTTTCDTLWMGVPVLTLPGEMVVARLGLSILSACGLSEWVAHSESEYMELAVRLAGDLPRLATLRATLRPRLKASAFMDAPRFARHVEQAYRLIWRTWCANQTSARQS